MAHYRRMGQLPVTRHIQFPDPDGALYYEELIGEEGFSSDSSLLYHRHIPSGITAASEWVLPDQQLVPNLPLQPRHLRPHDLFPADSTSRADLVTGRILVLGNKDVRLSYVVAEETSPLYRNAIGDEVVYIESGTGSVETAFGVVPFRTGDYVVIPRATIHRWVPSGVVRAFTVEANGHITPPRRYLSQFGQFLEHAPYFDRNLHGPIELIAIDETDVELLVKHWGEPGQVAGTRWVLPHHPFDVVGWDGCLYPYTLNIHDFAPLTGMLHQPPPTHQVFDGPNFVICNFVPRKVDYHPLSIPVPYYHSNVDSDEVLLYCGGSYAARNGSGIDLGSVSLHPGGHSHGPQPGTIEQSIGMDRFDELAVMIDTFAPLQLGCGATQTDDAAYYHSWSAGQPS